MELVSFEGLNCKNLTHPLNAIVEEEDEILLRDHGSVILEVDCSLHQQLENSTKYLEICSY